MFFRTFAYLEIILSKDKINLFFSIREEKGKRTYLYQTYSVTCIFLQQSKSISIHSVFFLLSFSIIYYVFIPATYCLFCVDIFIIHIYREKNDLMSSKRKKLLIDLCNIVIFFSLILYTYA
jgi:hypothetical protein